MRSRAAHYAMTGSMAAFFGLVLFLIVALDHPLWGRAGVAPDAFVVLQENIARQMQDGN